nr:hypothetical protein [Tanacetum cinerariifolium]
MARLAFCDYHNIIAILEKYEHNHDFHQIVDFVEASHIRVETSDEGTKILATIDGKPRTISKSSIRRNLKLNDEAGISSLPDAELFENLTLMGYNISPNQKFTFQKGEGSGTPTEPYHTPSLEALQSPQHDLSSSIHLPVTTETIPTVTPTDIPTLRQYSKRARIAQSSALPTVVDEPASPLGVDSQGEACPTVSGLEARQNMQTEMASKITAQDLEIASLKARLKTLEDKDERVAEPSGEDTTIKGRSLETGEEVGVNKSTERGSNDTKELVNVLTSLDVANILTSGGVQVVSVPLAAEVSTISVPTSSGMVPIASPIFTTASVVTPYSRQKVRTQFRVPRVSTGNTKSPTVDKKFPTGNSKLSTADMGNKGKAVKASVVGFGDLNRTLITKGNSHNNIDDKGYWDSGCSRHMTCNISYLFDYEPYDGGYVSFRQGGCKITGKGTIKTGKQHKASCKTKLVNSVTKPIHTLHMDLFGPTFDETSGILRNFNTKIENLKDLKVKIIRCDNGGKFRNKEMNDLCSKKGIKREFSNARTPQQNGVAERRNRTLIEAARTMLADAKLPVTFWAEAVNTVQSSSALGSLYLNRGNLSSLAVGKSSGSGNSLLAVGMP